MSRLVPAIVCLLALAAPGWANQPQTIDLTQPGAVAWGTAVGYADDLSDALMPIQITGPADGPPQPGRLCVPEHQRPGPVVAGLANSLAAGDMLDEVRTLPSALFPAIGATGWVPPDPTLAVSPTHIVATVNQAIAFYTKAGTQVYSAPLNNGGSPGFFEPVGAGDFTFDPKCFYDHLAGRFVVIAPEVYGTTQAWICIAVSDDSDPTGTWYKYRTNAVVTVGSTTFWWDYPGFGYDEDAYYVTSNLFGLNQNAWGGVGYRVFSKAPLLTGAPAQFATLRDGNAASVQVAQHFGDRQAPFFVSVASSTSLRVQAIRNPLTAPQLSTTAVSIPGFQDPTSAPSQGAENVSLVDSRIFNACWRDGQLYAAHNIRASGKNLARWYHMDTGNWPTSGNVSLVQSGNLNPGGDLHTYFPAIAANAEGDVAVVYGASSATQKISVNVSGRTAGDALGTMGAPTQLKLSPVSGGGRWGDYYGIAVDPLDDSRFWVIGEYAEPFGWSTWIGSFDVVMPEGPIAVADNGGFAFAPSPLKIDVLANDGHADQLPVEIVSFSATSQQGGTVALSEGTGPGGRDELLYVGPAGFNGPDSFTYIIGDALGETASASVFIESYDAAAFRPADNPEYAGLGLDAAYYALPQLSSLPDFSGLTPIAEQVVSIVDYPSTNGNFAGSGKAEDVGAVFTGYLRVQQPDWVTLYLESDDGSKLWIGDELVVNNDGLHGMFEQSGAIGLQPGLHALRIEFFERGGGAGLIARWSSPTITKAVIPASALLRPTCGPDFDDNGVVNDLDLGVLLATYGCTGTLGCLGDVNGDGSVNDIDLGLLLDRFNQPCSE